MALIRNGKGGRWEQMIENGQLWKEPEEIYINFSRAMNHFQVVLEGMLGYSGFGCLASWGRGCSYLGGLSLIPLLPA